MKIALDYDNTFSAAPALWTAFMIMAASHGHEVKIVTSRHPGTPVPLPTHAGFEIIYCSFTAKRKHYAADIWIDDDPAHVEKDHVVSAPLSWEDKVE